MTSFVYQNTLALRLEAFRSLVRPGETKLKSGCKASGMYAVDDSLHVGASYSKWFGGYLHGFELGVFKTLNEPPSWIPLQPCF